MLGATVGIPVGIGILLIGSFLSVFFSTHKNGKKAAFNDLVSFNIRSLQDDLNKV